MKISKPRPLGGVAGPLGAAQLGGGLPAPPPETALAVASTSGVHGGRREPTAPWDSAARNCGPPSAPESVRLPAPRTLVMAVKMPVMKWAAWAHGSGATTPTVAFVAGLQGGADSGKVCAAPETCASSSGLRIGWFGAGHVPGGSVAATHRFCRPSQSTELSKNVLVVTRGRRK